MRVDLRTLQPNPMRDFTIDPMDADTVDTLRNSISEYGFWGGVACRETEDGTLQIAAGHHRIEAAMAAGITHADVYVRQDLSDAEMVLIYGTENATQRGNTSTALAGTIASAVRFIVRAILTEQIVEVEGEGGGSEQLFRTPEDLSTLRGNLLSEKGLGRPLILRFLHKIHGINDRSVGEQLANLKASGDYARMITNIEQELEEDRKRALAAAEAAEQEAARRLEEELEAQARRVEAERKAKEAAAAVKAALEEEGRRKQERKAQEAKAAEERARAEAELRKRQREEAEQKQAEFDAMRRKTETAHGTAARAASKAAEKPKTFDFEGVAQHLKNAYQVQVFREVVTSPGIKPYLPVEKQAALARHLVELYEKLAQKDRRVEFSAAFIKDNITRILLGEKESARAEDRKTREALLRQDLLTRAEHYQEEFCRHAYGMATAGDKLAKLCADWPADLQFPLQPRFLKTFQNVRQLLERISSGLPKFL